MSARGPYRLSITFRSNERPFHTIFDPWPRQFADDDEAKEWATYMSEHMPEYDCTLLKNGEVLK